MYEFIVPDYKRGNIINLMSSISNNFGKKHSYLELERMPSNELKKFKNIILIVIDGLGYNYLKQQKDSFLLENLKFRLTSTFLSTTACANTSFLVGYPPQQSAFTGWDVNLKEIGAVATVLLFKPMYGGESFENSGFKMEHIMDIPSFHKGFEAKSFILIDKKMAKGPFTNYVSKHANVISTTNYKDSFTKLEKLINKKSKDRRFIQVYLPEMDSSAHKEGVSSKKTNKIFCNFDKAIKRIIKQIKGTNTRLIVTADHGLIDLSPGSTLDLKKVPGLKECLTVPIAGEPRVRDCFVRPRKVKDFEKIIKTKLSKYCWCFKGEKLIRDNFYGLGNPNKKLFDRVGDYVLIMKNNFILMDKLANYDKSKKPFKGFHGGVSSDEMHVPLIFLDA